MDETPHIETGHNRKRRKTRRTYNDYSRIRAADYGDEPERRHHYSHRYLNVSETDDEFDVDRIEE